MHEVLQCVTDRLMHTRKGEGRNIRAAGADVCCICDVAFSLTQRIFGLHSQTLGKRMSERETLGQMLEVV